MVLNLQKLIHLHADSGCDSEYSDWDDLPPKEKKSATRRKNKKASMLSRATTPFRSRRSVKEPPKSQDTTADLNGYIDAHKSSSVEAPVTRVRDPGFSHCLMFSEIAITDCETLC